MKFHDIVRDGRDRLFVIDDDNFRYMYYMRTSLLFSEKQAGARAMKLASRASDMIECAELLHLCASSLPDRHAYLESEQVTVLDAVKLIRKVAMMMPGPEGGPDIPEGGKHSISEKYHILACNKAIEAYRAAIDNTPHDAKNEASFLAEWPKLALKKICRTDLHKFFDEVDFKYGKRGNENPVIRGRHEGWQERLKAGAMKSATQHVMDFLPTIKPKPALIRGNKATSLMNIIVPQIESRLEQVTDPKERHDLQVRLSRLGDRVAIANANKSQERVVQDVRTSIEVLEQQVERQIGYQIEDQSSSPSM